MCIAFVLIVSCIFSIPVCAKTTDFDIENYSIQEVKVMSALEKRELISKYIDKYNPYGIRDLIVEKSTSDVEPYWVSDSDGDPLNGEQAIVTHQLMTLQALLCLINDFGFYQIDGTEALVISLNLAAASGLPDLVERDWAFSWHFYNPDTGKSYNPLSKTARDLTQSHFDMAKKTLLSNPNVQPNSDTFNLIIKEIGMALHYIQDLCEPHHSNNKIAGISTHSEFESFVDARINNYISTIENVSKEYYNSALHKTANAYAHAAAEYSNPLYSSVSNSNDKTKWDSIGKVCSQSAVYYSAGLLYKVFKEGNATFLK